MILHLKVVGSTNDWLRERADNLPDGQWLRADRQTSGRGRHARAWQSPDGNFSGSCLIRLQPGEERATDLGFVAAVALHEAVAGVVSGDQLQLKWPNDLLLDGGKLSGILLERHGAIVILGIGVNLAVSPPVEGRAVANLGAIISPDIFGEKLAASFAGWRKVWREQGFAAICRRWLELAHPKGAVLSVSSGGEKVSGTFSGLSPDGALRLQLADGRTEEFCAGDVWEG